LLLAPRRRPGPSFRALSALAFAGVLGLAYPGSAAVAPGTYDGGQTELAARLVLKADGRFAYALSYGALDEQAQGRWVEKDGQVLLTTEPAPKPPRFAVVSDKPKAGDVIEVALADPDLLQGSPLTMVVTYADAPEPVFVEAGEDGRLPVPAGKTVASLVPDLPVFPIPLAPYAVKRGGRRIVFKFEPNNIGTAGFAAEPLAIEGSALILKRYDRSIRFEEAED
jgi:hypothetical protein